MSSREELFATLQAQAVELGWQIEEPYDGEGQVEMMLTAPGACEQVISGTMLQARKQLNELGGPDLYPAVEEYDLPVEEALAEAEAEFETLQAVAEAMDIDVIEAADHLAYVENDAEWKEAAAGVQGSGKTEDEPHTALAAAELAQTDDEEASLPVEAIEVRAQAADDRVLDAVEALASYEVDGPLNAAGEAAEAKAALQATIAQFTLERDVLEARLARVVAAKARVDGRNVVEDGNGHVGVDDLHEDVSPFGEYEHPHGPTLKELWRAEVARPEQFLPEVYDMGKRSIIARKGDEVKVFWSQVAASAKADLEDRGFSFFSVSRARANELARLGSPKVAAQRTGRAVTKSVDGREVAPEGWRIQVAGNGLPVQYFKSVNEAAWEGFEMRLVKWA